MKKRSVRATMKTEIEAGGREDAEKLADDLAKAAETAGMSGARFETDGTRVLVRGWEPVSFLDASSPDEEKRKRLAAWMKMWSRLSKLGWEVI